MSLLNDALRKKKETQHASRKPPALKLQPSSPRKTIKKWGLPTGLCCIVVLGLVTGGWYWRQSIDVPSKTIPLTTPADTKIDTQKTQMETPSKETASSAETAMPVHPMVQSEAKNIPKQQAVSTTISTHQPLPDIPALQPPEPKRVSFQKKSGADNSRSQKQPPAPPLPPAEIKSNSPARNPGEAVARLYKKAKLYHRQNRLEKAIDMYREVLKIDPDHFDALFNLTSAYLQTGVFSKAYHIAADLHLRAPDNHQVTLNMAVAQIGIGRPEKAIQLLNEVVTQQDVPLFEVYFHKGVAHRHLGHLSKAISWYKKAERLNPSDALLFFNMAVAFDQQRQYDRAVHYYKKHLQASRNKDASIHLPEAGIKGRIQTLQAELSQQQSEEAKKR